MYDEIDRLKNEGNNIERLIETFTTVKDTTGPTIVHIHTQKGHGLEIAECNREAFHWIMPHTLDAKPSETVQEDYNSITKDFILNKIKEDKTTIAICAGTPGVFGYTPEYRNKLGKNYTDVGIAEEHAVAYSSALAKAGAKPILSLMSSFVQRTYDQLSQDLCLNNSPITMLIHWGGISPADCTHLCTFDIPLISNIPNIVYLAPACKEEYLAMLEYSYNQSEHPIAIRVPSAPILSTGIKDDTDYSILNKFKVAQTGEKVAIIGLGDFFVLAQSLREEIKKRFGFDSTLINPKFITGIDTELLDRLKQNHNIVVTLENGELDGGFGEKISRFYGNSDIKVLNYGSFKEFSDRTPMDELLTRYRLKPELIADDIENLL